MKNTSRLASGRVVVTKPDQVSADRYDFLDLASAEPNLGTGGNGQVLVTNTVGTRTWSGNLSIGNVTLTDDLRANVVYTDYLFYANGAAFLTGGYSGSVGYVGSAGYTGSVGFTGSIGYTGSVGFTGSEGFVGSQGNLGYTGSQGPSGPQGISGEYAALGFTGSQGATGPQGPTGPQGIPGEYAALGYTGSRGDLGYTGSVGPIGYTGSKGDRGPDFSLISGDIDSLGLGSHTWTVNKTASDSAYQVGNYVYVFATSSSFGYYMYGQITNYSGTSLTVNVLDHTGNGTYGGWRFALTSQIGYTGSRGSTGFSGSQGDIGFTGSSGAYAAVGFTGSQGELGYSGSIGFTGSSGAYAAVGFTGSQGELGYSGSIGFTGSIGAGYTGSAGELGYTGSSGTFIGTTANQIITSNTTAATSTTTGAVQVAGGVGVQGNVFAGAVYTEGLFYANGQPFVTSTSGSTNIYNGRVTATTSQTLVDSLSSADIDTVKWILSAKDTVNGDYKSSSIDSNNDGTNVFYNEYGIVLSDSQNEVATYSVSISSGNISLYATGTSASVPVTFQRITLGAATVLGNVQGASYSSGTTGSGTATVVNLDTFTGNGVATAYTLSVTPSTKNQTFISIGGILQPKNTYSLADNVITFSSAPPVDAPIEIQTFVTTTVTGYTGSAGAAGSQGVIGYTGSAGTGGGGSGYTGSAGLLSNWSKKTANYTAISGDRLIADTSGGSFTITLPSSPLLGDLIKITDGSDFNVNPVTVAANGNTIESQSDDVLVDIGKVDLEFVYDGTTWQIISTMGPIGYTGSAGGFSGTTSEVIITSNTTSSTSTTTGALQVAGGAGIAGNLYVGNTVYVSGNIIPTANNTVNLGSPTQRFGTLYISANTIDIGGATISGADGSLQFGTDSGNVTLNSNAISFLSNVSSQGPEGARGYTGSAGINGYTGSAGVAGTNGFTGSAGINGYTGSASTAPGYTGSAGVGYTGSAATGGLTMAAAFGHTIIFGF